ncbi:MAG TPA: hypothetical protein VFP65_23790 [Anaeromyxobacteraceae bacterium]|nr:hypothetical protein [Anaeromyxobacteraceae bacterium]
MTTTTLAPRDAQREPAQTDPRKPSARQVYCAAHLMCELLGLTWPQNRADASALIARLRDQGAAMAELERAGGPAADQDTADIPF